MSTYLVAFANGHFEYLESSYTSPLSNKTRPLRIYGNLHGCNYAISTAYDQFYQLPRILSTRLRQAATITVIEAANVC
jgi:hypothetical protein